MSKKLIEGKDYYWEEVGGTKYRVLTEHFLSKRGFCCGNKCRHCPFSMDNDKKK